MIRAVLFDIDNTLILYDEFEFFRQYIPRASAVFADIIPPESFADTIISATQKMMQNDGSLKNRELFLSFFCGDRPDLREDLWERFIEFYRTGFPALQDMLTAPPGIQEVFSRLQQLDIILGAASNPIWPEEVQEMRISWSGINADVFSYITHIENMSYCKPREEYYYEISRHLQVPPEECLMVGNDRINDLAAGRAGMKTYLTTDSDSIEESSLALSRRIRKHSSAGEFPADFTGSLSGVTGVLERLVR